MSLCPDIREVIDPLEFERMLAGGRVLQYSSGKPSAILEAGGRSIIKIVSRETGFTSDRLWPYGYRFYANSRMLLQRGIEAPRIRRYCVLRSSGEHVLVYDFLPGHSLLDLAERNEVVEDDALAAFYAGLHARGILFRSIHPGNILRLDDGRFALIDVTDTRFYPQPLSVRRRVRNLLYAWMRDRYRHVFPPERIARLLQYYDCHAELSPHARARFMASMQKALVCAGTL